MIIPCWSRSRTEVGEVHFRFLGTNGYHVKAKNDRFNATSSRCRQNLKYENFIMTSFGRLRQIITAKSVLHMQPDYLSSFNQSNHWFVALSLPLLSSFLKLPFVRIKDANQEVIAPAYGFVVIILIMVMMMIIIIGRTYYYRAYRVMILALNKWKFLIKKFTNFRQQISKKHLWNQRNPPDD